MPGDAHLHLENVDALKADLAKWRAIAAELSGALEERITRSGANPSLVARAHAALRAYRELEGK